MLGRGYPKGDNVDGIGMMLKSLGIEPGKIMKDFEALREGVVKELKGINEKLEQIQQAIEAGKKENEDFRLWLKRELEQEQSTQQQRPAVQPQPKPPQQLPQTNPPLPQSPQNMQPHQSSE